MGRLQCAARLRYTGVAHCHSIGRGLWSRRQRVARSEATLARPRRRQGSVGAWSRDGGGLPDFGTGRQ
jgi:hypothetical protein